MRVFIGMMTPPEVDDALDAALDVDAVAEEIGPGLTPRWTQPRDRHLTVRFIGETGDVETVVRAATLAATLTEPPLLRVGPRAVFLTERALVMPVAGAEEIAAAVDRELVGAGFEARPFTGHITLARAPRRRGGSVRTRRAPVHPPVDEVWEPPALEVIESVRGGPTRYRVVASCPFAGRTLAEPAAPR